jgi:hypothetical protein
LSEFYCPEIILSNSVERNLGLGLQLLCEQYDKEIKKQLQMKKAIGCRLQC